MSTTTNISPTWARSRYRKWIAFNPTRAKPAVIVAQAKLKSKIGFR